MNETTLTAFHEAGHAVAFYLLGVPFLDVSIVAEGDTLGIVRPVVGWRTYVSQLPELAFRRKARADLTGRLAGPYAEQMCKYSGFLLFDVSVKNQEFDEVRDFLVKMYGGINYRYHFAALKRRAGLMLMDNWPVVANVADALLARNVLSHADVCDICNRRNHARLAARGSDGV